MIEIKNISKKFGDYPAISDISLDIRDAYLFGMIGTNGAGKSTLMRIITGVIRADSGSVLIDSEPVYDNNAAKARLFFISDEPYFFQNSCIRDMERYYSLVYPAFDKQKFHMYLERFELSDKRRISTFSKGMKKQTALLLGLCANTKYLFCDETFDGLDPVMRQAIKGILAGEMEERGLTPIISSHNLRELEDICDSIGLLHRGGVLLQKDLEDMKCNIQKVHCVFAGEDSERNTLEKLNIIKDEKRGSLHTITIRGTREDVDRVFMGAELIFCEVLPLTLEEIFISETEVAGYDIKKLIFG